ncbi:hypothetical protein OnM2_064024 [Erysiphe neolycopersici]|uniref:Microbial-type PARG catalytic domain-containing protein n=1 Tax=Erysiphe neolycopersici TaxID=212602 RepID=A0A420HN74_9PEZI|nr:hypothetical protein OnM2_064024 [Erysiphe neolycopersici]
MPKTKSRGAIIAHEAKNKYIPHIQKYFGSVWPPTSHLCYSESIIASPPLRPLQCRFAFFEKDAVDLALNWAEDPEDPRPVPVIMPANERKPGGDWESSVMLPEECLCRRSNLSATLATPAVGNAAKHNYPIPSRAGIYSANVVIFRSGPERYDVWSGYKALPIISVCPPKRPKLDSSGKKYSFHQERDIMREKIYIALRIAIWYRHTRLCIGTFGLGNGFGNPTEEVAKLWRDAILYNPEFVGHFKDVVFSFESPEGPAANEQSSCRGASSSRSRAVNQSRSNTSSDLEIFRQVFKPSNIHNAFNP